MHNSLRDSKVQAKLEPLSERSNLRSPRKILLSKRNNEEQLLLNENIWQSQCILEKYSSLYSLFFPIALCPQALFERRNLTTQQAMRLTQPCIDSSVAATTYF